MKHIILVGFMGCGKSRVGRELSKEMGCPFVDMDAVIVKEAGMPITDIFKQQGEAHFRKLETEMLQRLLRAKKQTVISSGGGMPIQEANQPCLKDETVIYLKASVETLVERLKGDKRRPILQGGNLREKIITLKEQRDPIYEQVSNISVDTSDKTVDEVVANIISKL